MPLDNRTCFLVNLRDGLSCRLCGKRPSQAENYHRGFEYHHIVPRGAGGADTVENVALLCRACHQHGHQMGHALPLEARSAPERLTCAACGQTVSPQSVPMNCGWYACPHCKAQVTLFAHCFGDETPPGASA